MKLTLLAGAALAGLFACSGAIADPADSGWYGAIDLGGHVQVPTKTSSEYPELGIAPANLRFRTDPNVIAAARIGYKISPHFRVELEGSYRPGSFGTILEMNHARPPG